MNQPWPPAPAWTPPAGPPGPAPGVQFAPHGERLVAYIVDALIVSLVVLAGVVLLVSFFSAAAGGDPGAVGAAGGVGALVLLVILVISIGYFPWFWARGGQTPGMRLFGLRVVRDRDGGPVGAGQAILRLIGYWVNGIVLYIGFIWIFVDDRRRGWHDLIAGTVVIKSA
jgi:uncharacterized RDD family membrane protein YckC